jgi:hypothetical protein
MPSEIDAGDHFFDAASQSVSHDQHAPEVKLMFEIISMTGRLIRSRDSSLRLNRKQLSLLHACRSEMLVRFPIVGRILAWTI